MRPRYFDETLDRKSKPFPIDMSKWIIVEEITKGNCFAQYGDSCRAKSSPYEGCNLSTISEDLVPAQQFPICTAITYGAV